jgi:Sad1 / UNC-like C-terminal
VDDVIQRCILNLSTIFYLCTKSKRRKRVSKTSHSIFFGKCNTLQFRRSYTSGRLTFAIRIVSTTLVHCLLTIRLYLHELVARSRNMKYKARHLRRRLVLLAASLLPLLADDVNLQQQKQPVQPHLTDSVHEEDSAVPVIQKDVSSLPQHEMNDRREQRNTFVSDNVSIPKGVTRRRQYTEGRQRWIEEVSLPINYNGTTLVPYYPFELDEISRGGAFITAFNHQRINTTESITKLSESDTNNNQNETEIVMNHVGSIKTRLVDDKTPQTSRSNTSDSTVKHVLVDYASKSAGAVILDSSSNFQGTSNLLHQDRDKYAIVPCEEKLKYVVVGLSEDILVKQIAIANYERYSSHMKELLLFGSASTLAIRNQDQWIHLGNFIANTNTIYGVQTFDLIKPTWARYLKVEFVSHYGDEYYCTVSQLSVHGSTVLQGFHEQWNEGNDETIEDEPDNDNTEKIQSTNTKDSDKVASSTTVREADTTAVHMNVINDESLNVEKDERNIGESVQSRYNLTLSVYRTSLNFEETMMSFSSSEIESSREFSSLSLLSRPRSSGKLYATKTAIAPKSKSIRRLRVRPMPHEESMALPTVPPNSKFKTRLQHGRLSRLSSGIERVAGFVRSALGAFNASNLTSNLMRLGEIVPGKEEKMISSSSDAINEQNTDTDSNNMQAITSVAKDDVVRDDEKTELQGENALLIAKLLERLPSANCLEKLNFANFKATSKASSAKTRDGSSGQSGGSSSHLSMEPIFKKLTDEIKALQSNVAIHDQFMKVTVSCYQQIILELLLEMEMNQRSNDLRITKLEGEIFASTFVKALSGVTSRCFASILNNGNSIRPSQQINSATSVVVAALGILSLLYLRRRYRRRPKLQNGINFVRNGLISFRRDTHITTDDDDDSSAEILPISPDDPVIQNDEKIVSAN